MSAYPPCSSHGLAAEPDEPSSSTLVPLINPATACRLLPFVRLVRQRGACLLKPRLASACAVRER